MASSSSQVLGRLILLADLSTLPDEILRRAIREAAGPLPEIRAANMAFLQAARPALGAISDLGLQTTLSDAAEASALFIHAHERILPFMDLVSRMEGQDLRRLGEATRLAALCAQLLRSKTNDLAQIMKNSLAAQAIEDSGTGFRSSVVS